MALPSNTAQLAFMTLSIIAKRVLDYLKRRLYERLLILRPDTLPIKNNLTNTSAVSQIDNTARNSKIH